MTTSTPTSHAAGVATERSSRRRGGLHRPKGLPWVLPALVVSVGVLYYCIGYTGYLSTLKWDGASPLQLQVGFENYLRMFRDPIFWRALGNTAVFYVVTFAVQVALGIVLACLLHSRLYFKTVYKVLIFVPVVLAPATTAPVFRQIYAPTGTLNTHPRERRARRARPGVVRQRHLRALHHHLGADLAVHGRGVHPVLRGHRADLARGDRGGAHRRRRRPPDHRLDHLALASAARRSRSRSCPRSDR